MNKTDPATQTTPSNAAATSATSSDTVTDRDGKPITVGTVVEIHESCSQWAGKQGKVVSPHTPEAQSSPYTVAVYFFREVDGHNFIPDHSGKIMSVSEWDRQYTRQNSGVDITFLLQGNLWERSPRVVFFKPEDLRTIDRFSTETLANRTFPNTHHSICNLREDIARRGPTAYMCFEPKCRNTATDVALCNVWGSIYELYACPTCWANLHGFSGDDLPDRKSPILFSDGTPVPTE